jgi:biopolymer transport protein TolR
MSRKKKHLEFEINLIPAIDLLSVCICFLLLTAVWLHVGALNVKQAVGGQPASETAKKPTVWVQISGQGDVSLDVRDARVPAKLVKAKVAGKEGKPDLEGIQAIASQLKSAEPTLTTVLIQPQAATMYESIIDVMNSFKKQGMIDLGVSPL